MKKIIIMCFILLVFTVTSVCAADFVDECSDFSNVSSTIGNFAVDDADTLPFNVGTAIVRVDIDAVAVVYLAQKSYIFGIEYVSHKTYDPDGSLMIEYSADEETWIECEVIAEKINENLSWEHWRVKTEPLPPDAEFVRIVWVSSAVVWSPLLTRVTQELPLEFGQTFSILNAKGEPYTTFAPNSDVTAVWEFEAIAPIETEIWYRFTFMRDEKVVGLQESKGVFIGEGMNQICSSFRTLSDSFGDYEMQLEILNSDGEVVKEILQEIG